MDTNTICRDGVKLGKEIGSSVESQCKPRGFPVVVSQSEDPMDRRGSMNSDEVVNRQKIIDPGTG